jgi:hypothetical protein
MVRYYNFPNRRNNIKNLFLVKGFSSLIVRKNSNLFDGMIVIDDLLQTHHFWFFLLAYKLVNSDEGLVLIVILNRQPKIIRIENYNKHNQHKQS